MRYRKGADGLILDHHEEIGVALDIVTDFPSLDYPIGFHNLFANADLKDFARAHRIRKEVGALGSKFLPRYAGVVGLARSESGLQAEFDGLTPVVLEGKDFLTFRDATVLTALQKVPHIQAGHDLQEGQRTLNGARLMAAVLLEAELLNPSEDNPDMRFAGRYSDSQDHSFATSIREGAEVLLAHVPEGYANTGSGLLIARLARPALRDAASDE